MKVNQHGRYQREIDIYGDFYAHASCVVGQRSSKTRDLRVIKARPHA